MVPIPFHHVYLLHGQYQTQSMQSTIKLLAKIIGEEIEWDFLRHHQIGLTVSLYFLIKV